MDLSHIPNLSKARVVVVGDVIMDRWVHSIVERISPEAPIPVIVPERQEEHPGGAANVAKNLAALGCNVRLVGNRIWPATLKIRYVSGQHQVARVDYDDKRPWTNEEHDELFRLATTTKPHVLVISDYAKGVCHPDLCRKLIRWARDNEVKVVVDPKGTTWEKYKGAFIITPNEAEWYGATDVKKVNDSSFLVTRGALGMTLFDVWGYHDHKDIPAHSPQVVDVVGAGDTVVAVLAAAIAVNFPLTDAARLANAAAGVVVGKRGTATCSIEELMEAMR